MSRNIVILSDGTGQRGGVFVDERRSNIYKLYRATRCGPDSCVDPKEQVSFYDAGLGTLPGGIDSPMAAARSLYNLASQATGLGITRNIVDCYGEIIRVWRPGDRIFLFGFSRGAYTVRCLGGVLRLCGVPTRNADGSPLLRAPGRLRRLAKAGVHVYNYTNSRPERARTPRQAELLRQRSLLAAGFRGRHGSGDDEGGQARPYFVGVFDTVASLANPVAIVGFALLALVAVAVVSLLSLPFGGSYPLWFAALAGGSAVAAALVNLATRLRWAPSLPDTRWWHTVHLTTARMKMYDTELDEKVQYARHAISIDEERGSFARVPWGVPGQWRGGKPVWFEQMWFAGNHSDIGGSYAEDESRLSDIALGWMADAAREVGLRTDEGFLRSYPDATAMQHDEAKSSVFRFARRRVRAPLPQARLHPSVLERFAAPEVLHYDEMRPYRPEGLRLHELTRRFYEVGGLETDATGEAVAKDGAARPTDTGGGGKP